MSRPRPRSLFIIALALTTTYFLVLSGPPSRLHIVPYKNGDSANQGSAFTGTAGKQNEKPLASDTIGNSDPGHNHDGPTGTRADWEIDIEDLVNWRDPDDPETNDDVLPGHETDGTPREPPDVARLQHEKDLRKMWRYAYKTTAKYVKSQKYGFKNLGIQSPHLSRLLLK